MTDCRLTAMSQGRRRMSWTPDTDNLGAELADGSRTRGDLGQAWSYHQQALDLAASRAAPWHSSSGFGAAEAANVSAELDALPGAPGRASTSP